MAPTAIEPTGYPLFDTTFASHRVSPFYHGATALDNPTLHTHASQLRDILVGDVLRGVRVGLTESDESLSRIGALKAVRWVILRNESQWLDSGDETQMHDESTVMGQPDRGLHIEISYEKATYTALLLRSSREGNEVEEASHDGFTHYPLLLTRMPRALLVTLTHFLTTSFDAHITALRLPANFIVSTLEMYIQNVTSTSEGSLTSASTTQSLRAILRDVLISLVITLPSQTSTMKTIDITIAKDDLYPMLAQGRKLGKLKKSDEPFTTALAHYIDEHLALDLHNDAVRIGKFACGGFVIGSEGRIKLFSPTSREQDVIERQERAGRVLVESLIRLAHGGKGAEASAHT